jgi:hypothetical protein
MASDYSDIPGFLATREGESYDAQFSTSDYGAVGDQRPYQIVMPNYPAPRFLARFAQLDAALRECGTLCQLTGQPYRLIKWGSRLPCYPCRGKKRTNMLPGIRVIQSPGAIAGFPNALPIADFSPRGSTIVYGPDGQPKLVGAPNFRVSRTPNPPENFVDWSTPLPQRYVEAVNTAQYLARATGKSAYICSSFGADCQRPDAAGMKWKPVVYVQPGGLVQRYRADLPPGRATSAKGSTSMTTTVTENEFRELLRESAGGSLLGQGA